MPHNHGVGCKRPGESLKSVPFGLDLGACMLLTSPAQVEKAIGKAAKAVIAPYTKQGTRRSLVPDMWAVLIIPLIPAARVIAASSAYGRFGRWLLMQRSI
jgi:hypothetical protein